MDRPVPRLRLLTFLALAAFLSAGPVTHQVLGMERTKWLKTWRMYSTYGLDICRVRYTDHSGDQVVVVDRYAELGEPVWHTAPRFVRFIPHAGEVARVGKMMCKRRPSEHIEVDAECATRRGWHHVARLADRNLCTLTEEEIPGLTPRRQPGTP